MSHADFDDENEDLSTLDRGNNLEPQPPADKSEVPDEADEPKDEDAQTEEAPGEDTDEAPESGEQGEDDQPRDEKGRFKSKDDENLPIRLNKAKAQRDAERARADLLEAALRELQAKVNPKEPEVDPVKQLDDEVAALYEQVEEARLDGDTKLAAKLQREIDTKNREIVRMEAANETRHITSRQRDAARYDEMLDVLEAQFEELRPDSGLYDSRLVDELEFQIRAYNKAGLSLPDALRRASALLFRFDPAGGKPRTLQTVPDKKQEKPQPKKPNIERALETERKQPPDMSNKGVNPETQKIDISRLSDDEFDALPESVKRRYRGDEL